VKYCKPSTGTTPFVNNLDKAMKIRDPRRSYLVALIVCWVVSRWVYFSCLGVRLDGSPLGSYLQFIDPVLLKTALWQSTFYLNNHPPLFNLFLGVMLQSFGSHADWAFQVVYYGFGLGLAVLLYLLLLRLGIFPALAFLTTALFCVSPITLLYENWLFYTYPLTFLLVLSSLFLHRYVVSRRAADAVIFFSTLAVIILTRGIFHLAWLALVLLALWLVFPQNRRQLVLAAALPCLLVVALYCKNYLVFGTMVAGEAYQKTNFGMMVFDKVSGLARRQLIAEGKVTELADSIPYNWRGEQQYRELLPSIKRWGIPVLDQEVKSTGFQNWHSQLITELARVYYRDAKVAARQYPAAYPRAVVDNLKFYFVPADQTWPFFGGEEPLTTDPNAMKMRGLLRAWNYLFAGKLPFAGFAGKVPWLNLIAFPLCFLFGCRWVGLWALRRRGISERSETATAAVVFFMLYNIAYVAAVTILFSDADHSRYRFKVSPFYAALFSLFVASLVHSIVKRRLASRRSEGAPAGLVGLSFRGEQGRQRMGGEGVRPPRV